MIATVKEHYDDTSDWETVRQQIVDIDEQCCDYGVAPHVYLSNRELSAQEKWLIDSRVRAIGKKERLEKEGKVMEMMAKMLFGSR